MVYMGLPATENTTLETFTRTFRNHGYMAGWSDYRGAPLWVAYKLYHKRKSATGKRPQRFSGDWRNLFLTSHDTYTGSRYDRGHMAPNHAMALLYGRSAQLDSFLMTNIVPQTPELNQQLWRRLEEIELDRFAREFGEVWVVTGPVYDEERQMMPGWPPLVEIPDAFYKIYIVPEEHGLKALAFVLPQSATRDQPLGRYAVPVDIVEEITGLDFFPDLEDGREAALERELRLGQWPLPPKERAIPRYR